MQSSIFFCPSICHSSSSKIPSSVGFRYQKPIRAKIPTRSALQDARILSESAPKKPDISKKSEEVKVACNRLCPCRRRHFLGASGAALVPLFSADAISLPPDPTAALNDIHPPRPDWYEECYALVMDQGMKAYEGEISGYKTEIFSSLRKENQKVLELGVGTGPNFKYYAGTPGISVIGIDPNKRMEKYARVAAEAAGLPSKHFDFAQAVGEALPIRDASVDAVIGTLVLCSVKDVDIALKEVKRVLKPGGTPVRFLQSLLDPLQQIFSDGCHLTRETGKEISEAGFSDVSINTAGLSSVYLIFPHIYGVACK
ncbi:uncharacterized protein LOC131242048 isoform X2 [Magnolia sinica]|uniref:uncharacterized protein LOC131242048 isoform X2 n=1 Tax=Magnolia sinica TaxID=86752 RepID=UPI00265AA3C3|nr:uncharacterized protein LOC131242048 isoform X2 [Magnolia sinica]